MMVITMEGIVEIMLNLEAAETKETIQMITTTMTIKINYQYNDTLTIYASL